MRLDDITIPYLKSDMTLYDFSNTVDLTPSRVSAIVKRDLCAVYYKLFKQSDFELNRTPRSLQDKTRWLKRIDDYMEIINLPDKIKKDNRKISDLTVEEFIALMSSFKIS